MVRTSGGPPIEDIGHPGGFFQIQISKGPEHIGILDRGTLNLHVEDEGHPGGFPDTDFFKRAWTSGHTEQTHVEDIQGVPDFKRARMVFWGL